jgi:hypothetical protein
MLAHFSKALTGIGDAISKADLSAQLHKMERMKYAVAHLYAHTMLFFQQSVRWYFRSRIGRAVEAILHPVELETKRRFIRSSLVLKQSKISPAPIPG